MITKYDVTVSFNGHEYIYEDLDEVELARHDGNTKEVLPGVNLNSKLTVFNCDWIVVNKESYEETTYGD